MLKTVIKKELYAQFGSMRFVIALAVRMVGIYQDENNLDCLSEYLDNTIYYT